MLINLSQLSMLKLLALSKASGSDEIGGIMIGYVDSDQIIVTDITVPKQEVTAASISFDDTSMNDQISELFFAESDLYLVGWWHTHGDMKVFWSSTDQNDGINKFLKPLIENKNTPIANKWLASVVANAHGDILGRIDYYSETPFGSQINTLNDVPVVCLPQVTEEHIAWGKEEIKTKVTKHKYVSTYKKGKWAGKGAYKDMWSYYDDEDYEDYYSKKPVKTVAEDTVEVVEREPLITFSEGDEDLISVVTKSTNVTREDIEDLVIQGWTVSDAIDLLVGDDV